ncbi:hypothetical protein EMCRGX_G025849 [Ephydatia muelleri]
MGPQSPILHCHGTTVTNTPLPWDHSHQYSIAMGPQSPILHCHGTTVSISKQQTHFIPGGELGVARLTELEDVVTPALFHLSATGSKQTNQGSVSIFVIDVFSQACQVNISRSSIHSDHA